MNILLVGYIALEATGNLIKNERSLLLKRFSDRFLNSSLKMTDKYFLSRDDVLKAVKESGFNVSDDDVTELLSTGIFGSLWEYAKKHGCGLFIELPDISVKQESIEILEYVDANPYTYPSKGAFLIRSDKAYEIADALLGKGMEAKVIGYENDTKDRVVNNGGEIRYLTPIDRLLKDEQGKGKR